MKQDLKKEFDAKVRLYNRPHFIKDDPKGEKVYDDTKNCRLLLLDLNTGKTIKTVDVNFAVTCFESDGKKLYAGTFDGDIKTIDADLSVNQIWHPFDFPVLSVLNKAGMLVAAAHQGKKFIGDRGTGTLYFLDLAY